jgi:hypothetical protein
MTQLPFYRNFRLSLYCFLLFLLAGFDQSYGQANELWEGPFNRDAFIEQDPAISADGSKLVFVVYRDAAPGLRQMFECNRLPDGGWSQPFPISAVNQLAGEGSELGGCFLSYDGNTLYFHAQLDDSRGSTDLYYVNRKSYGWTEPVNMGDTINAAGAERYPSLAPDGRTLYFEQTDYYEQIAFSQLPKLMVSESVSGEWSKAVRLPPLLNASASMAPRILPDGNTLIFSSDGGIRGNPLALFISQRQQGVWQSPERLAYLNTRGKAAPVSVPASMDSLIFSKQDGIIKAPLQSAFPLRPMHLLLLHITDYFSGETGPAEVRLLTQSGRNYPINAATNPDDGRLLALLPPAEAYDMRIEKRGYEPVYHHFEFTEEGSFVENSFELLPESVDVNISLRDLITEDTLTAEMQLTDSLSRPVEVQYDSTSGEYVAKLKMKKNYSLMVNAENYQKYEQIIRIDSLTSSNELHLPLTLKRSFYDFTFRVTDAIYEFVPDNVTFDMINLENEMALYPYYDAETDAFRVELDHNSRYKLQVEAYGYQKYEAEIDADALISQKAFAQQIRLTKTDE